LRGPSPTPTLSTGTLPNQGLPSRIYAAASPRHSKGHTSFEVWCRSLVRLPSTLFDSLPSTSGFQTAVANARRLPPTADTAVANARRLPPTADTSSVTTSLHRPWTPASSLSHAMRAASGQPSAEPIVIGWAQTCNIRKSVCMASPQRGSSYCICSAATTADCPPYLLRWRRRQQLW